MVFDRCLQLMIQMDHEATCDLLERYEAAIPGKSSHFILLCNLRCYFDWYQERYESAIVWGERGDRLKMDTAVDTSFSSKHNLALAHRDGGEVDKAIVIFLGGESLEDVIDQDEELDDKMGSYYGNIGRCLYIKKELNEALVCYVKSARLLQQVRDYVDRLNRGYVRLWIAEVVIHNGEIELGAMFLRASMYTWEECSPPRAEQAKQRLLALVDEHRGLSECLIVPDWKAEGVFSRWLDRQ